jgi:exo-beta-1,3-glucanase (GH17 family)
MYMRSGSFIQYILFVAVLIVLLPARVCWPCEGKLLYGLCYGPFRERQSPDSNYPTEEEIQQDISIMLGKTSFIRIYGINKVLSKIPYFCEQNNINCYVGCHITGDYIEDQNTIANLIAIANQGYKTTKALIVGNEYVYEHFTDPNSEGYLIGLIEQVKANVNIRVTTGEPWDVWFSKPNLAAAVDFIGIHHYAYLRGFSIDIAAQENVGVYNAVKAFYPNKEVEILETGWPTQGEPCIAAIPSEQNQLKFLQEWLILAKKHNIRYFLFEAFDEPWKGSGVEGNWGLYYESRTAKLGIQSLLNFNSADIDFSGEVNLLDLAKLCDYWLEQTDANELCLPGDLTADGTNNFSDFVPLGANWLK